jgi:hypothetical protein
MRGRRCAVVVTRSAHQAFPALLTKLLSRGCSALRALVGGGRSGPGYLAAIEEIARHDGSLGWNMFVASNSALIALHPIEAARHLFGSARRSPGAAQPASGGGARQPYPHHRRMALLVHRQADWIRRARPCVR